ncbi:MAG: ComF family protein [Deltaproteobacteria bacterium]|nr:ComF family protein [Deltaproteobacteria bacterium]
MGAVVDVIFPPACGACRSLLPNSALLCTDCERAADLLAPPLCPCCGLPLATATAPAAGGDALAPAPCPDCAGAGQTRAFDAARALYVYGGPIETAIARLKFGRVPQIAIAAGDLLARALEMGTLAPLGAACDAVVPIPVGRARLADRGFDQAVLMARQIGRRLDRPLLPRLLQRVHETRPQAMLDRDQRSDNVRGAFAATGSLARGKRLLVVDDILTTGSTADAAAAALKRAGASRIEVVTLARAVLTC